MNHQNSGLENNWKGNKVAIFEFLEHENIPNRNKQYDLIIIDDVFPHPVSGFRYQEFLSYSQHFSSLQIRATGESSYLLGEQKIFELAEDFICKELEKKVKLSYVPQREIENAKLWYCVFLNNAISLVEVAEEQRTPFVFTLYPGGGFGINNPQSDAWLKRVTSSPCFRKVIVTQQITYDYLIEKNFCKPEQIDYIFGVVTPLEKIEKEYAEKRRFGIDKDELDICFVAHKYTKYGQDKGYDVFVEVAKKLSKKYENLRFHVVGNFDEKVIDISSIKDKIQFYGIRPPEWFDGFYQDKDIILSANIPGQIFKGSFDGFPTACCTDAGLCGTAIICTDPLNLNVGHFKDGEEIVIVPHDTDAITDKIAYFMHHPEELKQIGNRGQAVIKALYGFESQIQPRLQLLEREIQRPLIYDEADFARIRKTSWKVRVVRKLKVMCPPTIKVIIKRILGRA